MYNCTHCKYSYARMNCDVRLKDGCKGCDMRVPDSYDCKCTTHVKVGDECPDFELAEDEK